MDAKEAAKLLSKFRNQTITDAELRKLKAHREKAFARKSAGRKPTAIPGLDIPAAKTRPVQPRAPQTTPTPKITPPQVDESGQSTEPQGTDGSGPTDPREVETGEPPADDRERIRGLPLLTAHVTDEKTEPLPDEKTTREEEAAAAAEEFAKWAHEFSPDEIAGLYADWLHNAPEFDRIPAVVRRQLFYGFVRPATVVAINNLVPKEISTEDVSPEFVAISPGVILLALRGYKWATKKPEDEEK
jgi:hypothetical protein